MRETVNTVKKPTLPKIYFIPKTEDEKEYLRGLQDLLEDKRRGDWKLVAELLSIPVDSAEKAFLRVYSKNHFEAVEALKKIINNRKNLLKQP